MIKTPKKIRTTFTHDSNTNAKINQYIDLELKDYPIRATSKAIRDLIDIGMKSYLKEKFELSTGNSLRQD